jgi:hypothetical protein
MDESEKQMIIDNGFDNEEVKVMFWDELNKVIREMGSTLVASEEPLRRVVIDEWEKWRENRNSRSDSRSVPRSDSRIGLFSSMYKGSIRVGIREALAEMNQEEIENININGVASSDILHDIIYTRFYDIDNDGFQDYIDNISEDDLNIDIQNIWDEQTGNSGRGIIKTLEKFVSKKKKPKKTKKANKANKAKKTKKANQANKAKKTKKVNKAKKTKKTKKANKAKKTKKANQAKKTKKANKANQANKAKKAKKTKKK